MICLIKIIEFLALTLKEKELLKEEKLAEAFKTFDKDGSGAISADEICAALNISDSAEKVKIEDIVNKFDDNKSGEIDLDEFISMIIRIDL